MRRSIASLLVSAAWLAAVAPAVPAQSTSLPSQVYATVQVAGVPRDLLLDLVVPSGPGPWPLVVWVHGGGWSGGSRLPIPGSVTRLVPLGYAVASIDYRLTGQAIWPAQIQDCKAAIRFLRANAGTFGVDPNRIGVMGSSAGGHLVAALATMGDAGEVESGSYVVDLEGAIGPHAGISSRVQCAIDLFGPTNMLLANDFPTFDHDAANSPESRLVGGAIQDHAEKWATVDPTSFLTPNDPPLLALHGTDDTMVPFHMSELLIAAGTAIGHDVSFFPVQDNGHGGPGFSSPAAIATIDAFLARTLRDLPDVVVGVVASDLLASENGDPATFVVARSGSTLAPLRVALWLAGEAAPGADCERLPWSCTIPAGQSSTSLSLSPLQDDLAEGDESAILHLVPANDYRIDHAASAAMASLIDDDDATGLPVVSWTPVDPAASEAPGNPGAIRCVRTGPTTLPLTVHYTIAGTATNGVDYGLLTGDVTIAAGSATALVIVAPLPDSAREPGETVVLRLAAAPDHALGVARTAHVIITDDDRTSPLPTVAVIATDRSGGEPAAHGAFTVTRTGPTSVPLTVTCAIGGTAIAGADFAATSSSVTIPVGAAFMRVPITVLDDSLVEGPEDVTLSLLPGAGYLRAIAARQQLWIVDDEAPAPVPGALQLAVGPLGIGSPGAATVTGGAPAGFAEIWIGFAPGYAALPPFGVVRLDLARAVRFVGGALDGAGAATFPLVVPPAPALAGLSCWWQAVATTAAWPFLGLSDVSMRVLRAPSPF